MRKHRTCFIGATKNQIPSNSSFETTIELQEFLDMKKETKKGSLFYVSSNSEFRTTDLKRTRRINFQRSERDDSWGAKWFGADRELVYG